MTFRLAIAVVLSFASASVFGQQLKPEVARDASAFVVDVAGPEKIAVGQLAVFEVGKSTATKFAWTLIPSSPNFVVDTGLRKAYLAGAGGTFTIVLVGTDESGNVAIDTQTTVITGPAPPTVPPGPIDPPTVPPFTPSTATAVTFVYEKDQHTVPNGVLAALNKLNRERKIVATILEADTTDGTGQVPAQYKAALDAAKAAGFPALVVTSGGKVLAVVKGPKTTEEVLKVVP